MNVNMKTVIMVSTVLTAAGVMWGATTGTLGTVFLKKSDAQTTYVTKEIYAHDNAAISRRLDGYTGWAEGNTSRSLKEIRSIAMKFRKKPVVIEAMQFNGMDDYLKIVEWVRASGATPSAEEFQYKTPLMLIPTLEGTMSANPGDWIIRGVKGEFYPCKPDIFEATYEPVVE